MTLPDGTVVPNVQKVIADRGPEFLFGMDIPRLWATGVQVFTSPQTSILVFREQNLLPDNEGKPMPTVKNVASLVIPTDMMRELHLILGDQLAKLDGAKPNE